MSEIQVAEIFRNRCSPVVLGERFPEARQKLGEDGVVVARCPVVHEGEIEGIFEARRHDDGWAIGFCDCGCSPKDIWEASSVGRRVAGEDRREEGKEEKKGWGLEWLEDFAARDFPPTEWLYLNLIPARSTCVIVAPPNAGKTLLALDVGAQIVATAIASAKSGLRAAIVEEEGTGDAFQRRLGRAFAAAGGMPKRAVKVAWNSGRDLTDVAALGELAAECAGADLIVLDSLADLSDVDENDPKEMKQLAKALRSLQRATGATVIALHHMTKEAWVPGQVPSLRHLRGHGALAAKVDTVLALVPGDEESGYVNFDLYCLKQRDGEKAQPRRARVCMTGIAAVMEMEMLDRQRPSAKARGPEVGLRKLVLEAIPFDGKVTSKSRIAQKLRRNETAVAEEVEALLEAGEVILTGTWGLSRPPPPTPPAEVSAEVADPTIPTSANSARGFSPAEGGAEGVLTSASAAALSCAHEAAEKGQR